MPHDLADALTYAGRWVDLIHRPSLTESEGKAVIEEAKRNFADHFNEGWLEYRKSVTEAGDWAATEWAGSTARPWARSAYWGRPISGCRWERSTAVPCITFRSATRAPSSASWRS